MIILGLWNCRWVLFSFLCLDSIFKTSLMSQYYFFLSKKIQKLASFDQKYSGGSHSLNDEG